ncbi:hypothetical protein KXS07_28460 [Inquilinus limosus]|uniref:terpene synthase family protein n=1 Tax=Inquilinus limosus TaxID=171674 RepID=UPI003F150A75
MDGTPNSPDPGGVVVPPQLAMPMVEATFPRHLHSYWPELRSRCNAWLVEKRLMPPDAVQAHADGLRYTNLIAGYYVGASPPVLQAIADFSAWFFVWDDRHGRDAALRRDGDWGRLRDALHQATDAPPRHLRHPDPLVAGLADSVDRLQAHLSDRWNARFAGHFHAVIDAYDREYRERIAGTVPTVEDYVALRRHTFGDWVWLDCLELAAGRELPPEIHASDAYLCAGLASQEFCSWYNDLCSFPKELAAGELHNLGISLIHHEGLSVEQATVELRRRTVGRVTDFLRAETEVLRILETTGASPEIEAAVRHCLFNMRNWFSSTYWFHHESGRYRVADWADSALPPYVSDTWEREVPHGH